MRGHEDRRGTLSRNNVFVTRKVRPEELCVYVCVCVCCVLADPVFFFGGEEHLKIGVLFSCVSSFFFF